VHSRALIASRPAHLSRDQCRPSSLACRHVANVKRAWQGNGAAKHEGVETRISIVKIVKSPRNPVRNILRR
jgi:hypothetical protein